MSELRVGGCGGGDEGWEVSEMREEGMEGGGRGVKGVWMWRKRRDGEMV